MTKISDLSMLANADDGNDAVIGVDADAVDSKKDVRFKLTALRNFARGTQGVHFYRGVSAPTLGPGTFKVPLNAVDSSKFPSSSIYTVDTGLNRVTPTVAGIYLVNGLVSAANATDFTACDARIYKNGSLLVAGSRFTQYNTLDNQVGVSVAVDMNGSTDYLELWANWSIAQAIRNSVVATYMQVVKLGGLT